MSTAAILAPAVANSWPADTKLATSAEPELKTVSQVVENLAPCASGPVNRLVTDLIQDQVLARPDAPAICSWDAYYTYRDLDTLSTQLSYRLSELGVGPDVIVPILCDKSAITIVSMLAVAKAGGAFAALDTSHPDGRIMEIIQDTKAIALLASSSQKNRFRGLPDLTVVEVSHDIVASLKSTPETTGSIRTASPSNIMYLIFTSGSTGRPKGVMIEHSAYITSALAHGSDMGVGPKSRVLQFSSYAFDISIMEIFTTLIIGGTICVPSNEERYGGIEQFINKMGVNIAMLTPSYAKLLNPSTMPSLRTLVTVGEAVPQDLLDTWSPHIAVYISYGPAECAIQAAGMRPGTAPHMAGLIGRPTGCNIWVVKEDNHNEIVAPGESGELLIEGHILARGYMGDEEKTKAAFVDFFIGSEKRRAYKTGDIVRRLPDGTIVFVSRKDTQVKVQGMRFELTEIESRLAQCLPAECRYCVEKVETSPGQAALAVFLSNTMEASGDVVPLIVWTEVDDLQAKVPIVRDALLKVLPAPMVPSLYIPITYIPLTPSAKTNRKGLRQIFKDLSPSEVQLLQKSEVSKTARALTEVELTMRGLWATVLGRDCDTIGAEDNFIQLGGDSVSSIKLVGLARSHGISITSGTILANPRLCDMALEVTGGVKSQEPQAPFSMLPDPSIAEQVCGMAAQVSGLAREEIQDILPMTTTQMHMFAKTMGKPGAWVDRHAFRLPAGTDLDRFSAALNSTVEAADLLRARIYPGSDKKLYQAIVRYTASQIADAVSFDAYKESDDTATMSIGTPLSRYAILRPASADESPVFFWTIHHSVYDGYSIAMLLETINSFYQGDNPVPFTPFSQFLQGPGEKDMSDGEIFWKEYLAGSEWAKFPALPEQRVAPSMDSLTRSVPIPQAKIDGETAITTSNLIRVAYAAALSSHATDPSRVMFLEALSGRNAPIAGIDRVAGPTVRSYPTMLSLPIDKTCGEILSRAQSDLVGRMKYESFPLHKLVPLLPKLEFQSVLMIEDSTFLIEGGGLFSNAAGELKEDEADEMPMTFRCTIRGDELEVLVRFDRNIVTAEEIGSFAGKFEHVLAKFEESWNCNLADI
jgi:amino acid adenylation domain-containing protein